MKHQIDLRPFQTPNFVSAAVSAGLKQEGMKEAPQFAIYELSDETLNAMCDQFRADIFEKKKFAIEAMLGKGRSK